MGWLFFGRIKTNRAEVIRMLYDLVMSIVKLKELGQRTGIG